MKRLLITSFVVDVYVHVFRLFNNNLTLHTDVSFFSIVSYKCFSSEGTISEMFCVPGKARRAFMLSNCKRISVRKPNILFDVTGPVPGAEK